MTDADFIAEFEATTLPPEKFRHADHIRLAWLYLRDAPLPDAMKRFSAGLKRYAAALGKDGLYHETITFAFIVAINERMQRQGRDAPWNTFRRRNPDLFDYPNPLLNSLYRRETLAADIARQVFVLPDNLAPVQDRTDDRPA